MERSERLAIHLDPPRDPRTGRRLAGVGAVPREGTAAAEAVRAARQGCMTPALGLNVLLAGKPRLETKLQPAAARSRSVGAYRPGYAGLPARNGPRTSPEWRTRTASGSWTSAYRRVYAVTPPSGRCRTQRSRPSRRRPRTPSPSRRGWSTALPAASAGRWDGPGRGPRT